jgi:hypothetical protein
MMSIIFASPSNCDAFYEYPAARLAVHSPYSPSLPAPQTWPSGVAWPGRPPLPLYYSCVRLRRRRRATPPQAGLQVVASVKCYILPLNRSRTTPPHYIAELPLFLRHFFQVQVNFIFTLFSFKSKVLHKKHYIKYLSRENVLFECVISLRNHL